MIEIPYEKIIEKIKEQTDLTEEEIEERINKKLKDLNGLISKTGAAHILANELNVKIIEKTTGELKIKDLLPGMRDVTVTGKVTQVYELREFNKDGRTGKVANCILNDGTGSIRLVLWNDQTTAFKDIKEGTVLRIKNATVKENRGRKELHVNDTSSVIINPIDVDSSFVVEKPPRKQIKDLTPEDTNVEVLATIVQVFEPRFFEKCPECGKRAREEPDGYYCETHGKINPITSYVMNMYVDDGTGNIQVVLWQKQLQKLLGKTHEEILDYKKNPAGFEEEKTELLGTIVKIVGRVQRNEMFDRTDLVANLVFTDINPEEEIARLDEETKKETEKSNLKDLKDANNKENEKKSEKEDKEEEKKREKKKEKEDKKKEKQEEPADETAELIIEEDIEEEIIRLEDLDEL